MSERGRAFSRCCWPGRTPGGGGPDPGHAGGGLAASAGAGHHVPGDGRPGLDYEDGCFDAVISRNLTWTLPDPEQAYGQWFRVLKPGGVLLNFDADYAANVRSRSTQNRRVPADSPYGHVGMTDRLQRENDEITLTMDVVKRPAWDREVLEGIGFADCRVDTRVGRRILGLDLEHAPMFGIAARKP